MKTLTKSTDEWYYAEEFFTCICDGTAICLSHYPNDPDDNEISISLWERKLGGHGDDWGYRLRHIWQIITRGHPYTDAVVLRQEDALRLLAKLSEWTNKTSGTISR